MTDVPATEFGAANAALRRGESEEALRAYARLLTAEGTPPAGTHFDLIYARRLYRQSRRGQPARVAVSGWEMAHNAAGRVRALADIHAHNTQTEIVGATFAHWGNAAWAPVRDDRFPMHLVHVDDPRRFPAQALELVLAHPYDVVHLSKPRMPNIVMGLYYKAIWGARVLLDVDDEELGIVSAKGPMHLDELIARFGGRPDWRDIVGMDWTRVAVGLWDLFDGVTVSNESLRARYGGLIVPHARSAAGFAPSTARRLASRRHFGIGENDTVFLFFGTPRRHKGVLQTACALSRLGRDDLVYVIVGSFEDTDLKAEIEAVPNLRLVCLPDQPFAALADIVALGDACVILQDADDMLARHQFPAKLVDALAGGLLTFVTPTPALQPVIDVGAAVGVTPETLVPTLVRYLANVEESARQRAAGRAWFEQALSIEACSGGLAALAAPDANLPPLESLFDDPRQAEITARLRLLANGRG